MENGQLIDVLSGHTSTISHISLKGNTLASVSWDKTLRFDVVIVVFNCVLTVRVIVCAVPKQEMNHP